MVRNILRYALLGLLLATPAYAYSPPPNCPTSSGTQALNYATATNAFSCNSIGGAVNISLGTATSATDPRISGDATTGFYTAGAGKVDVSISNSKVVEWTSTGEAITGVATISTSLAIGGATIGTDALGVTGTATISSNIKAAAYIPTGSTVPTDGFYLPGASTSGIADNSQPVIEMNGVASAVDYVLVTNAATANPATLTMAATGTDTNINLAMTAKGTGSVIFNSKVGIGTSTVPGNALTIRGLTDSATTFNIRRQSNNNEIFAINDNGSFGMVDGGKFYLDSTGTGITYITENGGISFVGGSGRNITFNSSGYNDFLVGSSLDAMRIISSGNVGIGSTLPVGALDVYGANVNGISIKGSATTIATSLNAVGTDTNISLNILPKGTGGVAIGTTANATAGAIVDMSSVTSSLLLPVGTTGTRPAAGVNGMLRYNSTSTAAIEGYINNAWTALGSGNGTVTSVATTSPITGGTFTTSGTIACATCGVTGTGLQQFASTTSAQLFGVISDETGGSGVLVGSVSPTLTGTPAIAAATATTAAQNDSSTNVMTTQFYSQNNTGGLINKIRNPVFNVQQRGASGTIATPGTYQYTADGWLQTSTGAAAAWGITSGNGGENPTFNLLFFTGATSVTDVLFKQRVESIDSRNLVGTQNITVEFQVFQDTGSSITPKLTVNYPTAQDNYGAVTTAVNAVSLQAAPSGAYTSIAYTFANNTGFQNGMEIILDANVALNTTGKHFYVAGADMRIGWGIATGLNNTPSPIEFPTISFEVNRSQRFYRKSFPQGTAPAQNAGVAGAFCTKNPIALGDPSDYIFFNPPMRATPSFTTYNPSNTNANWRDVTGASDVTVSVDPGSAMNDSGVLIATTGTVTTLGDVLCIHYTASSEL